MLGVSGSLPHPFTFDVPIETERLALRPMTMGDVDAVHSYQSREDVSRYLLHGPRDRQKVTEIVAEYVAHTRLAYDGDWIEPAIVRRSDGQLIGHGFFKVKSVEHSTGEIGWTLHPNVHGRGYATEAARSLLALAFGTLRLHRVIAELDPRNAASVAVCRRIGMREEAHFVQDMWFKGEWADTGVHAILASEWAARTRAEPQGA